LLADGFGKPANGAETLSTLKPSGEAAKPATDMRKKVCSKAAEADRWDGREIDGKVTFNTPEIHAMERDPVALPVGLLPATLSDGWPLAIPVPAPRPAFTPASAARPLEGTELRQTVPAAALIKPKTK
jgi:D-alanyl-D-alanine carboxypeptidase